MPRLIRGFEADRHRSGQASVTIVEARRHLSTWSVTIKMKYASIAEQLDNNLGGGDMYPISAAGRSTGGGTGVKELIDLSEDERATLDEVLLPVELAGPLNMTKAQANAAALRVAAMRIAAPDPPPTDLTTDFGETQLRPRRYCVRYWYTPLRACNESEARDIANLLASTIVDHAGRPRGYVTELRHFNFAPEDDQPSERNPYAEIAEIADHAANIAALRTPMLMAGALLQRAWCIEAEEYQREMYQQFRELLDHPDRGLASPQQLHRVEQRALIAARGQTAEQLMQLTRQRNHEAFLYFDKFWTVDLDQMRRLDLLHHEAEVYRRLASRDGGG